MTKTKTTKRALLMSALTLLVCVSMLVGTTFAWFTDSVTSSGNIIKAGNLGVKMEWMEGKNAPTDDAEWKDASQGAIFNYNLWEPGYTEVRHIKISNVGTLALKYQINIRANGTVSELADVIDVYYIDPATEAITDRAQLKAENKLGTLSEVLDKISTTASGELLATEKHTVTIALKMQESAGNTYQNKEIGSDFSVELTAIQYTYEPDSFDEKYDDGLDPATSYVSTLKDLRKALEKGGKIKLIADITELDSTNVVPTGVTSGQPDTLLNVTKDVDLDLNGRTISLNSSGTTTGSVINIQNATLNIRGEGKIVANDDSDSAGWLNGIWAGQGATVNIYGGEFSGRTGCVLYGFKNGVINIYDGTYIVNTDSAYYDGLGRWLNVNNGDVNAYINIYGGTFVNFDFNCRNMTNPGDDGGNIVIADGYKGVVIEQEDGSTLGYVVPNDTTVVGDENAADLATAITNAEDGSTVMLSADTEIPANNAFAIDKEIVLDLNGKTLTSNASFGGIQAKGGVSIKNGTLNYTKTNAAIRVWDVKSIEDVTIICTPQSGSVIGGIVVQNTAEAHIDTIKNVTIIGATNGIECYRSTNEPAIGVMDNVKIEATKNGILLNGAGRIGSITNCDIYGANIGINAYLANLWHISLDIKNSKISGGTTGIDVWDEGKVNTGSTITLNYDDASVFAGSRENIKVTLQEEITCTINGASQATPCDVRIK